MPRSTPTRPARVILACWALLCLVSGASGITAGAPGPESPGVSETPGSTDRLEGNPDATGLLVIEARIRVPGGRYWLEAASLMREGDGGRRIRVFGLERSNRSGLAVFSGLEPGTYRIEFLEGSGGGGGKMRVSVPVAPWFSVKTAPGSIQYVGRIEVRRRLGTEDVDVTLDYEAKREAAAWRDIARRYENSLWAARAARRIADLKSGDSWDSSE